MYDAVTLVWMAMCVAVISSQPLQSSSFSHESVIGEHGFQHVSLLTRQMKKSIINSIGSWRKRNQTQKHPQIVLVSWLASDWSNDGYVAMRRNRQAYADSHGYQFLDFNESNLPTLELRQNWRSLKHFIKPRLLLAIMSMHELDWIVWNDADTLYTNAAIPWTQFLEPKADLIFAESPGVVSNNGVFAIRSTPWSKSFLMDWMQECRTFKPNPNLNEDNGPFVHSILRAYAKTHHVQYNNECRMLNNFKELDQCYQTHLRRISEASGLAISHSLNGKQGSALVNDSHVRGAWGINSGLNFKDPCAWKEGAFLLHFAGQSSEERRMNALRYSVRFDVSAQGGIRSLS